VGRTRKPAHFPARPCRWIVRQYLLPLWIAAVAIDGPAGCDPCRTRRRRVSPDRFLRGAEQRERTCTRDCRRYATDTAMTPFLCKTCGTQFAPSMQSPSRCPICEDERQFVGYGGQEWLTLPQLQQHHRNAIREEEPGLHSILTEPDFAIGERAFLVQTNEGNLLWDCLALINPETIERVRSLGGIRAIAISHPHFYTTMIEWSRAFGDVPIHLNARDQRWVMRPGAGIRFWNGDRFDLFGGLSLHRTGGHFDGFQVALWPAGAAGQSVLLAGDQPQVCADRRWVTFMYSYPNYIPLGPKAVERVSSTLQALRFDRLYGAFPNRTILHDAKGAIARSAERYLRALAIA